MKIARDYGVLLDEGVALRGLFIIDPNGTLRSVLSLTFLSVPSIILLLTLFLK